MPRVLDLGTGSGNIAVTLAQNFSHCRLTAIECSAPALDVALENARRHRVLDKIRFVHADMLNWLDENISSTNSKFDLIISNPPYIPHRQLIDLPANVQKEPQAALDGGGDGLTFSRQILLKSAAFLASDGALMMEIGDGQGGALEEIFKTQNTLGEIEFIRDYQDTDRILIAFLEKDRLII